MKRSRLASNTASSIGPRSTPSLPQERWLAGSAILRMAPPVLDSILHARVAEPLDRLASHEVLLDDLLDVSGRDVLVPDGLGIDDDRHSVLALVQASRLVGPHPLLQPPL